MKHPPLIIYTKEEDGQFVSICININFVSQGKTIKESLNKLANGIDSYLSYIAQYHADELDKYLKRDVHPDIAVEFISNLKNRGIII